MTIDEIKNLIICKKHIILSFFLFLSFQTFSQSDYQVFNYPNGNISSEGTLRDGKPDGYWKTYYENGQLKSEGNRANFLLDGIWRFFSETGDTTLIINYNKGVKQGIRYTFSENEVLGRFWGGFKGCQYAYIQVVAVLKGNLGNF